MRALPCVPRCCLPSRAIDTHLSRVRSLADAVWMAEVWTGARSFNHDQPCRDGDYDGDGAFRLADAVFVAELWAGARELI